MTRSGEGGSAFILRLAGDRVAGIAQVPRGTRAIFYRSEVPVVAGAALLAPFAGTYYSEELDVRYTLVVRDTVLAVQHRKLGDVTMSLAFADAFTSSLGQTVLFSRDAARRVTGFTLNDGRVRGVRFVRER